MFKLSRLTGTGLSDHHELISAVMKSDIFCEASRKKVCRPCKNVDLEHFDIAFKGEPEKLKDST